MDIFYLQKLFFCLGVLMIEISAYDQTYQLGLKDAEKFFSDDLSVPNVRYVEGEAFVGTKKVCLALGEFRTGNWHFRMTTYVYEQWVIHY